MRVGGPSLFVLGVLVLLSIPMLTSAAPNSGQATASYVSQGAGVITFVDRLTGDFHGVFAAGNPITIAPTTPFNIVGAVANDATSQRPPIAICIALVPCSHLQSSGVIGLRTVSARSEIAWPAGTPVNFYALNVATDINHLPAVGSSGELVVSWS